MNNDYRIGYLYISDICVIHKTFRLKNSKARLSIDIPLIIKSKKKINKNFSREMFSINKIKSLGKKYSIICPTKMHSIENNLIKLKALNS